MLNRCLLKITQRRNLTFDEARELSETLMQPGHHPAVIGALLAALKTKEEIPEEIAGFASGLKKSALKIPYDDLDIYDVAGTGGDGAHTVNISTLTAFVLAGAGVKVAKHGNRSISSRCGSADVLHHLGVNIHATPENIARQLSECGIGFIYAPFAHPSMKNVMESRKALGMPSIFNLVGPLANPLNLRGQMLGVYSSALLEKMAACLALLGVKNGIIVHGRCGLDEVSLCSETDAILIRNGELTALTIDPKSLGFSLVRSHEIKGGSAATNAQLFQHILAGKTGAIRETVILNTACALLGFGKTPTIEEGIIMARNSIDSGRALEKLNQLIHVSNQ